MRRGFKAESERIADKVRLDMGLAPTDRLHGDDLAKHLNLEVRSAAELVDIGRLEELEAIQPGAFSACTFEIGPRKVVVWNPLASAARRESDLAHEAAHQILNHQVKQLEQVGPLTFFSCDPDEEQEANWLAGCLLLPRSLLLRVARRLTVTELAAQYGVSLEMVNYRLRTTGVLRQVGARSA